MEGLPEGFDTEGSRYPNPRRDELIEIAKRLDVEGGQGTEKGKGTETGNDIEYQPTEDNKEEDEKKGEEETDN
ncbi:MAG TPA: hypothetical protein VJY47_00735 [Candidatus Dojkabacteria bacterium]|nr:hypothetical protein [Candidatus Dojkabacteria bacterium]